MNPPAASSAPGRAGIRREDLKTLIPLGIILCVFGAVVFWPANLGFDFHLFYMAGQIPAEQTYDLAAQRAIEQRLFAEHYPEDYVFNFSPFFRPAYYKAILTPLSQLPYWPAYWVWSALQVLSLFAGFWLLSRRFGFEPALCVIVPLSIPLWTVLSWGQDFWLVFLLLCGALELAMRRRDGWAGVLLALALIKWNVLLLLPLALVVQRRWRMLGAFCAVALVELLATFALIGRQGFADYFVAVQDPSAEAYRLSMPSLRGVLLNLEFPEPLIIVTLLASSAALLWSIRTAPFPQAFALGAAGSAFLSYHTMNYDFLFFFLPLVILQPHLSSRVSAAIIVVAFAPFGEFASVLLAPWFRGAYATAVMATMLWEARRRSIASAASDYSPDIAAGSLSRGRLRSG